MQSAGVQIIDTTYVSSNNSAPGPVVGGGTCEENDEKLAMNNFIQAQTVDVKSFSPEKKIVSGVSVDQNMYKFVDGSRNITLITTGNSGGNRACSEEGKQVPIEQYISTENHSPTLELNRYFSSSLCLY